ncbi:11454_t:CDS:1 [Diversispora eburnea]|uniref:11454_t:CDS:1 n=1 Tax=Diversispora eburnea TaxID=1213867 RepID=A0A9N9BP23_9GLOM|nr:11454_t:CDS:1 [Diversispora eburnea]
MTSSKSTQIITNKLEQKNVHLEHKDVKAHFKPWNDKCKIHAFSFEFAENSDSNPTFVIQNMATQHGFASAIIHAYTLHQHLRFSPDDVWLTVAQGVSRHIFINAKHFRYSFVDHEGQKDVTVNAEDIIGYFNENLIGDWPQAISRLSGDIDERVKKVGLKKHLECDFSTSTNASIAASQIILLDAMKKFFRYGLRGGCGIPKVTLDGTLEDWLHLQEKVAKIRDLGLELDSWLDRLEPVVAQFVSTYKGDVDEKFWSMALFDVPYASGVPSPCWNGWIGALFPYNNNQIFPDAVPSGLLYVPFDVKIGEEKFELSFAAGFFGAKQDKVNEEYVVSPVIGWYIADKSFDKQRRN